MKRSKIVRIAVAVIMCIILAAGLTGCKKGEIIMNDVSIEGFDTTNPIVEIKVKNYGSIFVELYPDVAPNTVNNFIYLVRTGFYDGLTFHRVISGFMIQGGDPNGNGSGGPGYTIKGEFTANAFTNNLSHERGVISMARKADPYRDSAGSQFFIMHVDYPSLDGKYAAFGKVISGIEIVDEIASVMTNTKDKPLEDVIMEKVTVDTRGVTYPEPVRIK